MFHTADISVSLILPSWDCDLLDEQCKYHKRQISKLSVQDNFRLIDCNWQVIPSTKYWNPHKSIHNYTTSIFLTRELGKLHTPEKKKREILLSWSETDLDLVIYKRREKYGTIRTENTEPFCSNIFSGMPDQSRNSIFFLFCKEWLTWVLCSVLYLHLTRPWVKGGGGCRIPEKTSSKWQVHHRRAHGFDKSPWQDQAAGTICERASNGFALHHISYAKYFFFYLWLILFLTPCCWLPPLCPSLPSRNRDGWHLNLRHVNPQTGESLDKRVVAREYYAYRIHLRANQADALFRAKRLFQEYCCMAFATAENQRLYYLQNQKQLRAELYNNLCDIQEKGKVWHNQDWKHQAILLKYFLWQARPK